MDLKLLMSADKAFSIQIQYRPLLGRDQQIVVRIQILSPFNYLQSDINRNQYCDILSTHIGRHYEKNDSDIFAILQPKLNEAIKNAKRLMYNYPVGSPPSQRAPATNFYELVEHLREYIE